MRARYRRVTLPGLGLLLCACGTTFSGTTLSQQVTSWAQSPSPTFSASVSEIQGDIRRVDGDQAHPASLPADCDVLVTDALTANQNLPSPDQTLTDLLSQAYAEAGQAGHDCLAGAGARTLARSATERTAAQRDLIKALARFDAVTTA